jgi:hypothetical protein
MSIKGILGTAATALGNAVGGPVGGAVAGSLAGAVLGNDSAKSAGQLASNATAANNSLQERIYNETTARNEPLYQNGLWANNRLTALLNPNGGINTQFNFDANDLYNDPSYAFRQAQGQRAIESSAAARGGLNSGATLKALTRYGQDYASTEYGNAYNRAQGTFNQNLQNTLNPLQSLAGQAQTSSGVLGAAGQNYANNISANNTGLANSLGAATIAQGNALSGGINSASSAVTSNNLLQQLLGQGGGSGAGWTSALNTANASSDPLASLNSTFGWTS